MTCFTSMYLIPNACHKCWKNLIISANCYFIRFQDLVIVERIWYWPLLQVICSLSVHTIVYFRLMLQSVHWSSWLWWNLPGTCLPYGVNSAMCQYSVMDEALWMWIASCRCITCTSELAVGVGITDDWDGIIWRSWNDQHDQRNEPLTTCR